MTGAFKVPDDSVPGDSPAVNYVIIDEGNCINYLGHVMAKCKDPYMAALIVNIYSMRNFIKEFSEGALLSPANAKNILCQIGRNFAELKNSGSC